MSKALIVFFALLGVFIAFAWFSGDKVSVTEVILAAVAGLAAAIEDVSQQIKKLREEIQKNQ